MSRYVEVVELGFKNAFRYGSNWTVFKFENGLMNIFGKNGVGKSSIIEILHFVFYGASYRGVNLDQLINKVNKGHLEAYVILKLTINGKTTTYKIRRGLAPKIEELYKNDKDTPETITGRFNTYIIDKILGFDANINKKIISVHSKNGSFISMKLEDRRQVIDSIVNLTQTKEYLKYAKTLLSEECTKRDLLRKDIEYTEASIKPLQSIVDNNKIDYDTRKEALINKLNKAENEELKSNSDIMISNQIIYDLNNQIDDKEKELTEIKDRYNSLNVDSINAEYMKVNSEYLFLKTKAKSIKNEISKIIPNTICTQCGNSYTEEHAKECIDSKNKEFSEISVKGRSVKNSINSLVSKLDFAKKEYEKVNEAISKIGELKNKLTNERYQIKIYEQNRMMARSNIDSINSEIQKLDESKNNNTTLSAESELEKLKKSLLSHQENMTIILDTIESLNYLVTMFSDEGIKALVLKKFLPILNKLINHYLKIFNLPLSFEITSDYKYTMSTTDFLADDYDGLSGGQQQRINLAILFAQTDLIKLIGNFKTNLLFLDEYIDGAVDEEGLNDTIKILKNITTRDNKSIIFISHRLNESILSNIDSFYQAKPYDDKFSELIKIDKEDVAELIHIK